MSMKNLLLKTKSADIPQARAVNIPGLNSLIHTFLTASSNSWPEPFKSNFYHSGGAQKSYIASKDDNPYFDFPPKQLNASEAAEVYPGDWPDVVYAWWFVYTNNQNRPAPEETTQFQAINCLCEAAKECGCAPVGWTTVSAFKRQYDHNAMIGSNDWNDDWIVNGTATARETLLEQNELRAQNEEDDESGASKKLGGSGWSVLALIVVAIFSGL